MAVSCDSLQALCGLGLCTDVWNIVGILYMAGRGLSADVVCVAFL